MSKKIILWSGMLILIGSAGFWLFWPSEEDSIRDQFDELSDLASKTGNASPHADALVLKEFGNLFSAKVVFKTGGRGRIAGEYTNRELVPDVTATLIGGRQGQHFSQSAGSH